MIFGKIIFSCELNVSLVLFEMSVMISIGFFPKKEIKYLIVLNIPVLLKHWGKVWDIKYILKSNSLGFPNSTCMSFSICCLFPFFHLSALNSSPPTSLHFSLLLEYFFLWVIHISLTIQSVFFPHAILIAREFVSKVKFLFLETFEPKF